MPFSDFRLMALALLVIAGCALATTLRSFGFTRWLPPKVRRLVQKCRAKLKRKPKGIPLDELRGLSEIYDHLSHYTLAREGDVAEPEPVKRPTGKRKRRPKK